MSQATDTWKQFAESYQTMSPNEQEQARAKLSAEQLQYLDQILESLRSVASAATTHHVGAAVPSGFETLTSDAVASVTSPKAGKGLRFADFEAEQLRKPGLFMEGTYAELDQVLDRLNAWVDRAGVDVINVETVVLPNLYSDKETGTEDVSLRTSGEMGSTWHQFFRVWYRG